MPTINLTGRKLQLTVQVHGFYEGFDWDALDNRSMPAPFVPHLKRQDSLANFDVWRLVTAYKLKDIYTGEMMALATHVDVHDVPVSLLMLMLLAGRRNIRMYFLQSSSVGHEREEFQAINMPMAL